MNDEENERKEQEMKKELIKEERRKQPSPHRLQTELLFTAALRRF